MYSKLSAHVEGDGYRMLDVLVKNDTKAGYVKFLHVTFFRQRVRDAAVCNTFIVRDYLAPILAKTVSLTTVRLNLDRAVASLETIALLTLLLW